MLSMCRLLNLLREELTSGVCEYLLRNECGVSDNE